MVNTICIQIPSIRSWRVVFINQVYSVIALGSVLQGPHIPGNISVLLYFNIILISPDTNPWGTYQDLPTTADSVAVGNKVAKETTSSKQGDVPLLQQPPKRTRPRPSLKAATPTHPVTAPPTTSGNMKSSNVVDIKVWINSILGVHSH